MSLTQAAMGESVLVVRVSADGSIRRRLQDLGITTGAELTPLSFAEGNMIVCVHDARIAVNDELARTITVTKRPAFAL